MIVFLIGSEGFIGSNILRILSNTYDFITCDIISGRNASHYIIDKNEPDFDTIFKNEKIDICINASGASNVTNSYNNISNDFHLNANNVSKLLNAIKENAVNCKYINMSSAAVYGNPTRLPINETFITKPISPYGYHKLISEIICDEFYSLFQIKTVCLRIFSVYGEGLKKQLFWDVYQRLKGKKEIELFGNGLESRDFIYINDLVYLIDLIIKTDSFNGEVVNVASGKEVTIKEAAETFTKFIDPDIKIKFNNIVREGDPRNWKADISKIKSIGFKQGSSLKDGLYNYLQWLQKEKL